MKRPRFGSRFAKRASNTRQTFAAARPDDLLVCPAAIMAVTETPHGLVRHVLTLGRRTEPDVLSVGREAATGANRSLDRSPLSSQPRYGDVSRTVSMAATGSNKVESAVESQSNRSGDVPQTSRTRAADAARAHRRICCDDLTLRFDRFIAAGGTPVVPVATANRYDDD